MKSFSKLDVDKVIRIELIEPKLSSYKWLPKKQKTFLFGLIKRNRWNSEGFYRHGCYQECYESGCFDATPDSEKWLTKRGYYVYPDKSVWHPATVHVDLDHGVRSTIAFGNMDEAKEWISKLEEMCGKKFINYGK